METSTLQSSPAQSGVQNAKVASQLPNSLLQRLMEEVKNESQNNTLAYDRTHNRHNRS